MRVNRLKLKLQRKYLRLIEESH